MGSFLSWIVNLFQKEEKVIASDKFIDNHEEMRNIDDYSEKKKSS
jgi:hypothetical protein